MNFRTAFFTVALFSAAIILSAQDYRPKFDKSGAKGYITTQANPWFPFAKERIHNLGGPNYAMKDFFHTKNSWVEGFKELEKLGLDVIYLEINDGAWYKTYMKLLQAAKDAGLKIKLGMFVGVYQKTPEAVLQRLISNWRNFKDDLKNHPNVHRIDGRPVVLWHLPAKYPPETWKMIQDGLEREFGPMIFLCNIRGMHGATSSDVERLAKEVRRYLPYMDGLSNYGSSGVENQRLIAEKIAPIMHKEFPQKLYEGCIHGTYTCHFHMGGLAVDLSKYYRQSFDIMTKAQPDSINITNLFDHYENSLIFPCYEREDFMLRYAQYWSSTLPNGKPFMKQKTPELVVTNHVMNLLGKEDVRMEVIGFPIDAADKKVKIRLDLCETSGKIIKSFPEKELDLSKTVQVRSFTFSARDAAKYRGVVPRLNYTWRGRNYKMNHNPMTLIAAGVKSYHMYWARSTKNQLQVREGADKPWYMGGVSTGGTLAYPKGGIVNFMAFLKPKWQTGNRTCNYTQYAIKRNGNEFYRSTEGTNRLNANLALPLPASGEALQYFHLEMENEEGVKFQTLPIWVAPPNRKGMVKIPVWTPDKKIEEVSIEAFRVPFYYYPCNTDSANVLLDISGYVHNGNISGGGYGGGHLGFTGYYYYHNGPVSPRTKTKFLRDEKGKGFYRFEGKDAIIIMGGTAMPYASTYEISVRVPALGKKMGLFGTGNNQINLAILPDGKLWLQRANETEGMGGTVPKRKFNAEVVSKDKIQVNQWHKVAVTYDLKKIRLYLDGKLQGEAEVAPSEGHEWINHLIVGALCKWVWTATDRLTGDIRDIRIYGRNLKPEEFLK
ncbi:MAG: LamG domain-containing protein [Lentisphaeria bacterium]|nr:LamG domain-containing protein [Lentisphaeria bacterium]